MSIGVSENPSAAAQPKPTKVRALNIIIHNGTTEKITDENGNETCVWTSEPYAEIVTMAADPMLDKNGDAMVTPDYGQPAYVDRHSADYPVKSIRISDPSELMAYIGTLFDPIMSAADSKIAEKLEATYPDLVKA